MKFKKLQSFINICNDFKTEFHAVRGGTYSNRWRAAFEYESSITENSAVRNCRFGSKKVGKHAKSFNFCKQISRLYAG